MAGPGANWLEFALQFMGDVVLCILISHGYRYVAKRWGWLGMGPRALVPRLVIAVLVLGAVFMVLIALKLYLVRRCLRPDYTIGFYQFEQTTALTLFVTGTRLMSIWVLAYHLYHFAQKEIHTARDNAKLSVIAKEAQLNNLAAQLNPHFFFNSLNNIKFLVEENPVAARRAIDLLSDLLRHSLYNRNDRLITAKDELQLVTDYLELEKFRLEERLQVLIDAGHECLSILLPPFSIQVLVENAIKHGIAGRKEGGLITVKLVKDVQQLTITVSNSGRMDKGTNNGGLGLKNLSERLQLQYNGQATVQLTEQSDEVCAIVIIPAYA